MVADAPTPCQPDQSFFWVNKSKHSLSLSHSNKVEKQRIFSHAQRWQRAAPEGRDVTGRQKPRSCAPPVPVHRAIRSPESEKQKTPRPVSHNGKGTAPNEDVTRTLQSQDIRRDPLSDKPWTQVVLLNEKEPLRLTRPISTNGSTVDPFKTTAVVLNKQTYTLLNYYIDVIWPAMFYFETSAVPAEQHPFHLAASTLIHDCISNKVDMTALLAQAASRMENATRARVEGGSGQYVQNAIRTLRQHLRTKPVIDNRLIRHIFHIFSAEGYRCDLESSRRHVLIAKELIERMGGLAKIDPHLMEMLVTGELLMAAVLMVPSVFAPVYDPGGSSVMISKADLQILWVRSDSARLGEALMDPMQADIVSGRLRMIIADMVECAWIAEGTMSLPVGLPTATRWLHLRNMAIRHHLLGVEAEDGRANALRIALLLWILLVMTQLAPLHSAKLVARTLRHVLLGIDETACGWGKHGEVQTWILLVGALCADVACGTIGSWFVEQLAKCSAAHGVLLDGEAQLCLFAKRFFYVERVQRASFRDLARKLATLQRAR